MLAVSTFCYKRIEFRETSACYYHSLPNKTDHRHKNLANFFSRETFKQHDSLENDFCHGFCEQTNNVGVPERVKKPSNKRLSKGDPRNSSSPEL